MIGDLSNAFSSLKNKKKKASQAVEVEEVKKMEVAAGKDDIFETTISPAVTAAAATTTKNNNILDDKSTTTTKSYFTMIGRDKVVFEQTTGGGGILTNLVRKMVQSVDKTSRGTSSGSTTTVDALTLYHALGSLKGTQLACNKYNQTCRSVVVTMTMSITRLPTFRGSRLNVNHLLKWHVVSV